MIAYVENMLSGTADPLLPHIVLLSISVVASVAVGAGIIFESPKYTSWAHEIATKLVIGGVAAEALCTIGLFAFDETISHAQQLRIESLDRTLLRFAARTLTERQAELIGRHIREKYPDLRIAYTGWDAESNMLARQICIASFGSVCQLITLPLPQGSSSLLYVPHLLDGARSLQEASQRMNDALGPLAELGFSYSGRPLSPEKKDAPTLYIAPKELPWLKIPWMRPTD